MKKRGFGAGKLNGVGGKVARDESVEAAAVREAKEEIGVVVEESDLVKVAELSFAFKDKPDWSIFCHVFFTSMWSGEPFESEEMAPEWFSQSNVPYERMWIDDKYWLPNVLQGDFIKASFNFTNDGSALLTYTIEGTQRI